MSNRILFLVASLLACLALACSSFRLGRRLKADPQTELKIGHDQKADVERKLGRPFRSFVDSEGREVYTYLWADGEGHGQKVLIAFNKNDVVYLIEVSP
jgi:hypothetical protein